MMEIDINQIIKKYIGGKLRSLLVNVNSNLLNITEIRIRINKPLIMIEKNIELFLCKDGQLVHTKYLNNNELYCADQEDIKKIIDLISNYSLYAFEEEIKNGYITIEGGHRVGICGHTVIEGGEVKTIRNINGFNFRISHQIIGCGNKIIKTIANPTLKHALIISPPRCGKTTLLRDIVRLLSNGTSYTNSYNVAVADERSEIGGCFLGVAQNDIGIRTDILDGVPKAHGMKMLLRSMSPDVIVADEIGRHEDIYAIEEIINCGVKLICSAHGNSIEDLLRKPILTEIINKRIFQLFIVLKNGNEVGEIEGVYNENFEKIGGEFVC